MADALGNGRRFRCLNIIGGFTRECLAIEVDHSLPALRVIEVLERLCTERGLPPVIVTDNGCEFTSRVCDAWAYAHGVKIGFIQPGTPVHGATPLVAQAAHPLEVAGLHRTGGVEGTTSSTKLSVR